MARHLIDRGLSRFEKMKFESGVLNEFGLPENELLSIVRKGKAFMIAGCTGCSRPFANKTLTQAMKGLLGNYPFPPIAQDIRTAGGDGCGMGGRKFKRVIEKMLDSISGVL